MYRVACLLAVAGAACAQLTLDGVKCGQLRCQLDEYCSSETNRCAPCSVACNTTHHNYDSGLCVQQCQVYLLDLRYMQRTADTSAHTPSQSVAQRQAQTALIISGVALAVLLLILIKLSWGFIKHWAQPSKNRVKQHPIDLTHHNPHAEMARRKPELKIEIRNPKPPQRDQPLNVRNLNTRDSNTEKSAGATTPKTVSTALSNRHPAEDTTLDFSYDNMAMNTTPPEPATGQRF